MDRRRISGFIGFLAMTLAAGSAVPSVAAQVAEGPFRFVDGNGYTDLIHGQDSIYRLMTLLDPAALDKTKKVFHHLYGRAGDGFLTKGHGGLWGHHRGIMLGWSSVIQDGKDMNFWECPDGNIQKHEKFLPERELVAANLARRASVTAWQDPAGRVYVRDTREVTAWIPQPGQVALDFAFTVKPEGSTTTLEATPHHGGVSFRAIADVADSDYIMPADVKAEQAEVFSPTNANAWVYGMFTVNGHGYGVLFMDHPSNPRPLKLTHREYGRFGSYFGKKDLAPGTAFPIAARYIIFDMSRNPAMTLAAAQALYDAYALSAPASTIPPAQPVSTAILSPKGSYPGRFAGGVRSGFRAGGLDVLPGHARNNWRVVHPAGEGSARLLAVDGRVLGLLAP